VKDFITDISKSQVNNFYLIGVFAIHPVLWLLLLWQYKAAGYIAMGSEWESWCFLNYFLFKCSQFSHVESLVQLLVSFIVLRKMSIGSIFITQT